MPRKRFPSGQDLEDLADEFYDEEEFERPRSRRSRQRPPKMHEQETRRLRRDEPSGPFKCSRCKNFIGIPPTGGRHRNHCPMCLYSLHVDEKTPGDRRSECESLMEPIGTAFKPDGEQMVVHRCRGCGVVRYNRVAADDNPVLLDELPVMDLPTDDTYLSDDLTS